MAVVSEAGDGEDGMIHVLCQGCRPTRHGGFNIILIIFLSDELEAGDFYSRFVGLISRPHSAMRFIKSGMNKGNDEAV